MRAAHRAGRLLVAAGLVLGLVGWPAGPAAADRTRDRQWYRTALDVAAAHRITRGAGVTVALIDTGVDARHRDLKGAILPGKDVYPRATGDGREDFDGHGTQLAGLIAGRGHGHGAGVLGIAPAATILPIRAPLAKLASASLIPGAIRYAVDHGATVINMSFGGAGDESLHEAVRAAQAADVVLIAAVGNTSNFRGHYPGRYPEVLAVGATDRAGKVAPFSVRGPQLDLMAPGVDIVTTGVDTPYSRASGTSGAAAIVSGAAALVRARYPDLSAAEVVHRLTATATDAGPKGRDDTYGYGRLNLVRALTAQVAPVSTPPVASASAEAAQDVAVPTSSAASTAGTRRLILAGGAFVFLLLLIGAIALVVLVGRSRARPTG